MIDKELYPERNNYIKAGVMGVVAGLTAQGTGLMNPVVGGALVATAFVIAKVAKKIPPFNTEMQHPELSFSRVGKRACRYIVSAALPAAAAVVAGTAPVHSLLFGWGMLEFSWHAGRAARALTARSA